MHGSPPPITRICSTSSAAADDAVTEPTADGSVARAAGSKGRRQRDRGDRLFSPWPCRSTATDGMSRAASCSVTGLQHQLPCQKPWTSTTVGTRLLFPSGPALRSGRPNGCQSVNDQGDRASHSWCEQLPIPQRHTTQAGPLIPQAHDDLAYVSPLGEFFLSLGGVPGRDETSPAAAGSRPHVAPEALRSLGLGGPGRGEEQDDKSRMTGDCHVLRGSPGVRFPRATRLPGGRGSTGASAADSVWSAHGSRHRALSDTDT